MDFQLDDTTTMIQGEVRSLARGRLAADAMRWNEGHGKAGDAMTTLARMGLLGMLAPERDGGAGLDVATLAIVLTELAAADAGLGALVAVHNIALDAALGCGLSGAVAGAGAGTPRLCWIDGRASGHLDDETPGFTCQNGVVNGAVPVVVGVMDADVAVVVAGDDDAQLLAIIDLHGAGVERLAAVGGLVGLRSADVGGIACTAAVAVAVAPATSLAWSRAASRVAMAAVLCGSGLAAFEAGVRYTLAREQFGKAIATFQPMQWQTADAATALEAARLLLGRAAWMLARDKTAEDTSSAMDAADRAAIAAFEAARGASDRALQMHGGYGYTKDYAVERPYRDVYALPLIGGTAIGARGRVGARLAANA